MNIVFIKHFFLYDIWFLRYIECPYSGTVRIQLLSPTVYNCSILILPFYIHIHTIHIQCWIFNITIVSLVT